jgi:hypothetical protein
MINKFSESIDSIYQSINIYRSIIIYNDTYNDIIKNLYSNLINNDYPVILLQDDNYDNLDNYRMYIINIKDLYKYNIIFNTISTIIYLDDKDYNTITNSEYINQFNNISLIKI